jgi:vitamin B12 transporter
MPTRPARIQGVTFAASHRIGPVQLHGSLMCSARVTSTPASNWPAAPSTTALSGPTLLAGWTLGAEVQASGRRFDTVANTNVLGGYTLVNLYASTRIARDYTLLARVDNLADKDYQLARTPRPAARCLWA